MEVSSTMGVTFGPVVGSAIYAIAGFSAIFYFQGTLAFIFIFVPHWGIDKEADRKVEKFSESEEQEEKDLAK